MIGARAIVVLLSSMLFFSCNKMIRDNVVNIPDAPGNPLPVHNSYYISPRGNDSNPGTEDRPWRTIQHAAGCATPGGVVYAKEGRYYEKIVIQVSGNEADGPITFQPFPGHKVVIDGSQSGQPPNTVGDCIIFMRGKNFITIKGFEIANARVHDGAGIRVYGSGRHIRILNNKIYEIRGSDAMGISAYGTDGDPISDILIQGNEIFHCDPAHSEALTLNGNVRKFQITANIIHDVNNIGIDMIGGEKWLSREVVRDGICNENIVYRAKANYGGGWGAGIYVDGAKNIVLERNRVFECDMGMEIGAEQVGALVENIIVRNNLVYHNDKVGISLGPPSAGDQGTVRNCMVINNTVYENNRVEANGEIIVQHTSNNLIVNNIVSGKPNKAGEVVLLSNDTAIGISRNDLDYNLYYVYGYDQYPSSFIVNGREYSQFHGYRTTTGLDIHSVYGDPLFVSPPRESEGGCYLRPNSPAHNTGLQTEGQGDTDFYGQPRTQGGRIDRGAVEQ
ncbi:MAG: right-handed parallel beta-helix repeat-containing protein [Spirochaetales bacterium]|nr:right-handed parallel beta-helix repeat-containing protein [Spirochaetales bacterium]